MNIKNKTNFLILVMLILVLVIVTIIGFFLYLNREQAPPVSKVKTTQKVAYHIPLDSLEVVYGTVSANQNLSTLLSDYISAQLIDQIARESGSVFDVRKIKSGNRFARIITKDSLRTTRFFVYEINPIDFVVYDFSDSLRIYKDQKKVDRMVKTATGTIKSSLWNCFVENNLDVGLALALSDVYAWTVDFYGLQKGDNFKVIFEEVYVEGKMIGIDKIIGAKFQSNGKDFYAYRFEQAGKAEYFDEKGQSLQRSFLKAPLKFSRISSRFSRARMHPILRIARPHFGVDYSAPKGTPVVALGDGRIGEVGYKGGYGKFISIRHNSVYMTTYAHLSGYAKGIKSGVHVSQGQVIGYVGSTGLSTGPHLDFRVYKNGTPTDPLKMESPPSKPVESVNMKAFLDLVKKIDPQLKDSIKS
jgi:murein DD-endopeptidase MepM/ murein hydrolase activator NlpD